MSAWNLIFSVVYFKFGIGYWNLDIFFYMWSENVCQLLNIFKTSLRQNELTDKILVDIFSYYFLFFFLNLINFSFILMIFFFFILGEWHLTLLLIDSTIKNKTIWNVWVLNIISGNNEEQNKITPYLLSMKLNLVKYILPKLNLELPSL